MHIDHFLNLYEAQGRSQGGVWGFGTNPPLGHTNIADGHITTTKVSQEEFSQRVKRGYEVFLLLISIHIGPR